MAQHDNVASWLISIGVGDASPSLDALKGQFQAAANDIQRITSNITVFAGLEDKVKSAADALASARQNVITFTGALGAAGDAGKDITGPLQTSLAAAQRAVTTATAAYNTQVDALSKLENSLTAAGVDTGNLAAAQAKYTASTLAVTDALKLQNAQQTLGLVTTKSIAPELDRLNSSLATMRAGFAAGTVTQGELTQAERLFAQQTAIVEASVTNLPGLLDKTGSVGVSAFESMGGPTLTLIALFATLVKGIKDGVSAGIDLADGLGKIGSVTELTGPQLDALGDKVRALSVALGVDAPQALQVLYQIIRSSNLGADNAITVLDASARAAKASFTDLGTVAGISTTLISAFGLKANEVSGALDALYASSKAAGPTFTDLAGGIGKLSVSADAAGLTVNQMSALLNVMTAASGDGAGAVTALQQILVKFNTDAVREQLRQMGITTTNAADAIQQLTDRGDVNLNKLLDLGIATGRTAAGVVALTGSSNNLADALTRSATAAGQVAEGLEKIENTPTENIAKASASIKDLATQTGLVTLFNDFLIGLTKANNELSNNIKLVTQTSDAQKTYNAALTQYAIDGDAAALQAAVLAFNISQTSAELSKFHEQEAQGFGETLAANAQALDSIIAGLNKNIADAQQQLQGIGTLVQQDIQQLNDAAKSQEDQVAQLAATQIAALDRSVSAQITTAAQTVQIQAKSASDRLAIITQNELDVNIATQYAKDVRQAQLQKDLDGTIAALTKEGADEATLNKARADGETKIEAQIAQIRIAAIAPTIAAYQKLYADLVAQEQGYASTLQAIEQKRRDFTLSINQQILDLQLKAVDDSGKALVPLYDQQVALSNQANADISLARTAAANGDVASVQKYTDAAIAASGKTVAVYGADGEIILSQTDVLNEKVGILAQSQDIMNTALNNQKAAAKSGYDATASAIDEVKPKLDAILAVQQQMQAAADAGLHVKLAFDETSITDYQNRLDVLTQARTVVIKIKTENESGQPVTLPPDFVGPPSPSGLARGGYVNHPNIRGFATGGFAVPSWSKVPGVGDGDTVPARLRLGSFVVKKAASGLYGDGLMGTLAHFASGGSVGEYDQSRFPSLVKLNTSTSTVDPATVHQLKVYADALTTALMTLGLNLPPPSFGQSLVSYLFNLKEAIDSEEDGPTVQAMVSGLDDAVEGYKNAFAAGRQFHAGVAVGVNADPITVEGSFTDAFNKLAAIVAKQRFATGGPVGTDTIPAYLTPGEFVFQPPAVQNITKMYGGGFLPALNDMRIAPDFLERAMTPPQPRYFATGGYVDGPGAPSMPSGRGGSAQPGPTFNINVQSLDENTLNRVVKPWFTSLMKTSR